MNIKRLRLDFPIFGKKGAPREYVYLDSAATSQKPQQVIDAITNFYAHGYATVHRGVYDLSEQATIAYEATREKVAQCIGAADSSEIVFTSGATAGINMIADTWARANLKPGDEILITQAEHHANFLPWQRIAQITGAQLKFISINPDTFVIGCPEHTTQSISDSDDENVPDVYASSEININKMCNKVRCTYPFSLVNSKTKLLALVCDSNVLGNIWDENYTVLKKLIAHAHAHGAKVLLDIAQTIGHRSWNLQDFNPDFVVFSAHKMFGPTGVGVLYINRALHNEIEPYQLGGSMVHSAGFEQSIWKSVPHKFEAGTPPIAGVIGFGAALEYIKNNIDYTLLAQHEEALMSHALNALLSIDGMTIIGNHERIRKGHLVSFVHETVHAHDIASYLDVAGIALRAGNHCAQPLATALAVESTLRVSIHAYNTLEDIDRCISAINEAIDSLEISYE